MSKLAYKQVFSFKTESKVIALIAVSNPEKAYLTVKPNLSEINLPNFQLVSDSIKFCFNSRNNFSMKNMPLKRITKLMDST